MWWVIRIWKCGWPHAGWRSVNSRQSGVSTRIEILEVRLALSVDGLDELIFARPGFSHAESLTPFSTVGPTGYSPDQIRNAYGFSSISFAAGTIPGDGRGMTIAIVNAFDHPYIEHDLNQFNLAFGLPACNFTKVDQFGGTSYPRADPGWAGEIALDVQWAHAIAPLANILLVEAIDNSLNNLLTAVDYARSVPGVVAVSMSWGAGEFAGETAFDHHFTTPAGHGGVTFIAASGDTGAPASYPSSSPNIMSIGGTTLSLDSQGNIQGESAWAGSGGGISLYQPKPSYQTSIAMPVNTTRRATPDVAYDSNPNTGFPVYDSFNNGTTNPWYQVGGTSAAAPQWAGLVAIAAQGRALNGSSSLDGATETLPLIYSMDTNNFYDITTGSSAGKPPYRAVAGFDFATGRGSPRANLVVRDLVGDTSNPGEPVVTSFAVSAPQSSIAGETFGVTVTALDAFGNPVPSYTGTIAFASLDTMAGLPENYAFTEADNGIHSFSGIVLKTAGSQFVSVTDTVVNSVLGTATIVVEAAAADHLSFGQQPQNVSMAAVIAPAVTVRVLDAFDNLVIGDNGRQISLLLGTNPGSGTLSGTNPQTVVNGVATFGNLSINQPGSGYTLVASATGLSTATSASFNVVGARIIEDFETGNLSAYRTSFGTQSPTAGVIVTAAHDGNQGLQDSNGRDWIYRNDVAALVKPSDTISVWMRFEGSTTGLANFGFGAGPNGTLSLAASGLTNQVLIQSNVRFGTVNIAATAMTWSPDHWYRIEVAWASSGGITGRIFDSNGTTLLKSVSASSRITTSGGIAFRSVATRVHWDTVEVIPGSGGGGGSPPPKGPGAIGKPIPTAYAGRTLPSPRLARTSVTTLTEASLPVVAVVNAKSATSFSAPLSTSSTPPERTQTSPRLARQNSKEDDAPARTLLESDMCLDIQDTLFRNPISIEMSDL